MINPEITLTGDGSEREPNSATVSKLKEAEQNMNIGKEDIEKLRERLLCVSCVEHPRSMLIDKCKHVPFCIECDKNWKL